MLSSFLIGTAIVLGFVILYLVGMQQLSGLLRRRFQDEAQVAKYWGITLGIWTVVTALAFGLVTLTDLGQPISKLGPYISGIGILFGIGIALTKFKPNED